MYGFFYGKNKSDNEKLDLMRAVMESPSATKSFLSPGNFDTIKTINKEINNKKKAKRKFKVEKGELVEDINATTPSTWVQIADQMNTGKALIGIAANANAAHAIFQHARILRLDSGFWFTLPNEKKEKVTTEFNDLTALESHSGRLITKNIAELLAAFVDNGKDPQAKYSNINNYTIDVAIGMALAGVDLKTIQYFLTQDIIEDFVSDYANAGANAKSERDTKLKYGKMLNTDLSTKQKASPLDIDDLTNFTASGLETLQSFLAYKDIVKPISNLILALKQGENGLGPTDSDNLSRIDMIDNAVFDGVEGADELLRRQDLFPYHLNQVIKDSREVIVNKAKLPDRNKGAFAALRERFRNFRSGSNLTVNQIEFINKNYLDYLASGFGDFAFDKNLIAELPKRLENYRSKNPEKYSLLLSRLQLDVDKPNKITYIVYTGLSGQDKHLVDRIRDDWEAMLLEGSQEEQQLAKDLIKYTFMLSGFRISPQSFSHLAPVLYFTETIPEFNKYMRNQINSAENTVDPKDLSFIEQFYHQFVRNHFRSLSYIPTVDLEVNTNYTLNDKQIATLVLKEDEWRGRDGALMDYVKVTVDKQPMLLAKTNVVYGQNEYELQATYVPVEPLGTYKSQRGLTRGKMFTHYAFGNNPINIFKQNKIKNTDTNLENEVKLEEDFFQEFDVYAKNRAYSEVRDAVEKIGLTPNRILTLRRIVDASLLPQETNEFRKALFDGLKEVYYTLETRVIGITQEQVPARHKNSQGWFNLMEDTINLNIDELANQLLRNRFKYPGSDLTNADNLVRRTILHESIHAFQMQKIQDYQKGGKNLNAREKRLMKKLDELYTYTKKTYPELSGEYGMSSIQEFLTEAFSNETFANRLKEFPGNVDASFEGDNIFQKLISLIKEIFNYIVSKGKSFTIYAEAKDIMSGLAQEQVNEYLKDLERKNNPNYNPLDDLFKMDETMIEFGDPNEFKDFTDELFFDDEIEFSLKESDNPLNDKCNR